MPRKGKQTSLSQRGATKHRPRASISDLHDLNLSENDALLRGHSGKSHPSRNPVGAIHTQVKPNGTAKSSSLSLAADEEEDGGTSGSDISGDEEEHNNGDDDDAEAMAPSDRSMRRNRRRTGLLDGISAGTKRRRSPHSSEEEHLSRKVVRPIVTAPPSSGAKNLLGDSDDEEYNAVDFISDSEEEEPSVEQLEEKMIIDSEEANESDEQAPGPSAAPSASSVDWEGFDLDDGIFLADIPFFDDEIGRTEPNVLGSEIDVHDINALCTGGPLPSPTRRHVRFADAEQHRSSNSSTHTSDAEDDVFPDLFLQQDSLDPYFRLLIENDNDVGDGNIVSDGEGSCWDFGDHENFELEKHGLAESSGSACGSSSGYETDEGETTDEEVIPPSTVNRPQTRLRCASGPSFAAEESLPSTPIRKPTAIPASRRYGPSMGSWVADPTKPIAVIDSTGKHMVIIPAQRPTKTDKLFSHVTSGNSTANNSPRNSFAGLACGLDESDNDRSDFSSQEFMGSMCVSGANVMMPGLLHGAPGSEHTFGGQVMGPPEAFYPFKSIGPDGEVLEDADEDDDEDDDDENLWNVHDFIDFGDGSSEDDKDDDDDTEVPLSPTSPVATSSNATIISTGSTHNLLDHFDRGVVTAFRRNQHRHQALLRRPIPSSSLRGGGAIKGGRHIAANSPISPLRKRKLSNSFGRTGSPLVGAAAKKRVVSSRR
ncbi:MAG: hypothetical protein FRX48_00862 [Lasallia pustulata]|uniref:Uncharacterized protein n=1 Tax=Lasallia pustulata TaxID=136370 RepID=A0A5M8Q4M6_9LECA|nr:MAG: hypothetical protein FRX48_00862 [Lasallia pustulata]